MGILDKLVNQKKPEAPSMNEDLMNSMKDEMPDLKNISKALKDGGMKTQKDNGFDQPAKSNKPAISKGEIER